MRAGGERDRGALLYLLQTLAIGALMLPEAAWGQVAETLAYVKG